jgi:hypothetical protein
MKKGFAYVMVLCACGGNGDVGIDGGDTDSGSNNDGATNDVTTNDVSNSDVATNDVVTSDVITQDVATFNPANVIGLVLWLEADVSSSITLATPDAGPQKVTKWADQTSHHNDAMGLQQNFARNPSVKSNQINKLPTVHFDQQGVNANTGQMLTVLDNTDTSLQWGTGDFFVAVVGDFDNNVSNGQNEGVGLFYSKAVFSSSNTPPIGLYLYGNVPTIQGNPSVGAIFATAATPSDFVTTSNAYNNGNAHLFAIRRRGAKLDLLVDGVSVATSTSNTVDVTASKSNVRIGADGDANIYRLDGDIGEMLAVKGVLSLSDEQGLMSYLKAKWATP